MLYDANTNIWQSATFDQIRSALTAALGWQCAVNIEGQYGSRFLLIMVAIPDNSTASEVDGAIAKIDDVMRSLPANSVPVNPNQQTWNAIVSSMTIAGVRKFGLRQDHRILYSTGGGRRTSGPEWQPNFSEHLKQRLKPYGSEPQTLLGSDESAFGNLAFVRWLVADGFVLEDADQLVEAVHAGSLDSVELLLAAGGAPFVNELALERRMFPLEAAAINCDLPMIRLLASHGARITVDALDSAVFNNSPDQMQLLLDLGGDRVVNDFLHSYISSWTVLIHAVKESQIAVVNLLLAHGADVNAHRDDQAGDTALAVAVTDGNYELAKLLVEAGADPRIEGWMRLTAIDCAAERKRTPELLELMVSAAARLEKRAAPP